MIPPLNICCIGYAPVTFPAMDFTLKWVGEEGGRGEEEGKGGEGGNLKILKGGRLAITSSEN